MNYSVLMSVYYKEKAEFFEASIESMLNQTALTNDFVIVCDGPLTQELDAVIKKKVEEHPDLFQIIALPENLGIGGAADEGLRHCKNDLVAKMDSDDIARAYRCEKQLEVFARDPEIAIVGGQLSEFQHSLDNIVAVRKVPTLHKDIILYAKRRMPFNNQTVMYRKSVVDAVGGYSRIRRCEDYDLYVRMLQDGYKSQNCEKILVDFRLNEDAYSRRGMKDNLIGFIKVRWEIHKNGFSSFLDFLVPCCGQVVLSIAPNSVKDLIYKRFLRNR